MINIITNKTNDKYQIIWATGKKQYEDIKQILIDKKININDIENMKILPYIYDMEEIMNISDLIVARSGAMTVTEVSKLGKPAIFIPYPLATENHQEYNAKVLEEARSCYNNFR
jgi:UDP-N-acetylglucosamine--N-acetylmuramyl-(pentapeptide) pyrophosphoryl-undecaprenol N-acetylglucosamine transferase